ncbi:GMC oxidoreductase [Saccharopolyspora mangrovi]|uniref:GMC oxidoreductase n=1 Tax=Saccharopolyspora mangrovi TaxID=3082379 RepID=A0ABU6AEM6_9PSEU|nr:GMC oxidoreductase [Saccharopolyspora sp. S2-29]MEB3369854.1 GMC oxidoreductase [Saccharopolyspora sp. S2-29]
MISTRTAVRGRRIPYGAPVCNRGHAVDEVEVGVVEELDRSALGGDGVVPALAAQRRDRDQRVGAQVGQPVSSGVGGVDAQQQVPLVLDEVHGHDREITADTLRRMRELFAQEPIARHLVGETVPGTDVTDEHEIADVALNRGHCGYHAVGTCAMGPDPHDVVDSRLRVRGVEGLRVVDSSVLPTMISGNLTAPVMAIAWRAADVILDGTQPS